MPLSAAEKQRRSREKRKKDPEKVADVKRKDLERYHARKKLVKDMTSREHTEWKRKWQISNRKRREKQKALQNGLIDTSASAPPPTSPRMVRNYVRKTNRGNWSAEQIKNAVSAILNKTMNYSAAVKTYGIPKSTLVKKVKIARNHVSDSAQLLLDMIPQEDVQTSTCVIKTSVSSDAEESVKSENIYLMSPNKRDPIAVNNSIESMETNSHPEKEHEEDASELYGRLLATKLRQVSEQERLEIMYEIDGLILKRLRQSKSISY